MVLATPAIFSAGWKPGWLGSDLRGTIPGTQAKVRLAAACVERWRPMSGWSLETGNRGEKPVRRVVPAGSVYFFERESADDLDVAEAWLKPVSDGDQFSLDGFGVVLWGKWKPEGEK
jgi:CRISPR-associated protein Cmr3